MVDKVKFTPLVIPFEDVDHKNPATVDLVIENHFYKVFGFISYDNRYRDLRADAIVPEDSSNIYTKHKGHNFVNFAININNPFSMGGRITSNFLTSMSHEDNDISLGYAQPINSHGTSLFTSVSGRWNKFPIKQEIKSVEAGALHPLFLSPAQSLDLSAAIKQSHVANQYNLNPNSLESFNIKKFIISAYYALKDKFSGSHKYSVNYHQSIKINQSNLRTKGHDKSFRKYIADANISYPFFCSDCKITFDATGQYSKNNLFRTEVFTADINNGARGFDDSEIYGDKGLSTSIELSKYLPIEEHLLLRGFKLYTYLDRSKFWNNVESFFKPKSAMITSYGLGTNIYVQDNIIFNLEYSKPLSKTAKGSLYKLERKPGSRIYFGLRYEFGF